MGHSSGIHNTILDAIGQTPIVKLHRLSGDLGYEVYAKLENLNPGGSHKVRIAQAMIQDAEKRGVLHRGSGQVILEPSGGNTGIGLAMVGALYGYRVILVIPDNYSPEKQAILRLYGAETIPSDSRLGNNSHGEKAMEILLENPHYVMLNQQRNPANPAIHRATTAQEILRDFGDTEIDVFVAGIGTGGHITGVGEELKKAWPTLEVVGVQPEGCDLFGNRHVPHDIQGLSVGLIPQVLNTGIIDRMESVSLGDCLSMIRRIMRTEGISLGISSAANLVAIEQGAGNHIDRGARVLTMIYDGAESYLQYFGATDKEGAAR
ncbi:PLP-dependent cysteine synthase family protein [Pseudothauera rhizosphaerae]|uniref:Cysteine synthase n=1 Tax=Pseudothauera rhizosphaerae TaxID=2565932 RepID=A0A4S4AU98_9RHOO|nr:cysteine synthase family protein [Pseudothauera rhizosphaerae]THF63521.1 cysteine synthase family protein [Pseudothauera rhizosphaerae]